MLSLELVPAESAAAKPTGTAAAGVSEALGEEQAPALSTKDEQDEVQQALATDLAAAAAAAAAEEELGSPLAGTAEHPTAQPEAQQPDDVGNGAPDDEECTDEQQQQPELVPPPVAVMDGPVQPPAPASDAAEPDEPEEQQQQEEEEEEDQEARQGRGSQDTVRQLVVLSGAPDCIWSACCHHRMHLSSHDCSVCAACGSLHSVRIHHISIDACCSALLIGFCAILSCPVCRPMCFSPHSAANNSRLMALSLVQNPAAAAAADCGPSANSSSSSSSLGGAVSPWPLLAAAVMIRTAWCVPFLLLTPYAAQTAARHLPPCFLL